VLKIYDDWCQKEGVHMPKLQYPAVYGDGLVGTEITSDIEYSEGFLYVPFKMMLSTGKARNHPVLSKIINSHPTCFSEDLQEDSEQLILVLFLFYEISLGTKSYWYPYLIQLPTVIFSCFWSEEEANASQDQELINCLEEYRHTVIDQWFLFKLVLEKHPDTFPKQLVNKLLFYNVYG
jgi:hypothetical protein